MFVLFFNLYLAMFRGTFVNYRLIDIKIFLESPLNAIGTFFTSLFNNVDTPMDTLGTSLLSFNATYSDVPNYLALVALVLSLITSIGIVVMAVKGIKRVFSIFFMGIR